MMDRKEQPDVRIYSAPGAMRKPGFSHKRSANKGVKKLNTAFAPLEKL